MSHTEPEENGDGPPTVPPPPSPTREGENCAICRSSMGEGGLSTTPCGHTFHFQCMSRSMMSSPLCPICRRNLRPDSPIVPIDSNPRSSRRNSRVAVSTLGSRYRGSSDTENPSTSRNRDSRNPGRNSPVIDIEIEDFANNQDIQMEILSGILHSECRHANIGSTRELISDNPSILYSRGDMGDLLTHEAVLSDSESMLMYIVNDQSVDVNLPNCANMYPLHYAVVSGSLRMVTILVNRGAYIDCVNDSRMTPLMLSCEGDDSEITQFLLDRGASFRTQDGTGNFPIHIACRAKSYSCASKLISAGATVKVKNHFHDTPLHVSCRLGYHSVTRLLLEEGADPEVDNKFDYSPLDEATSSGNNRMRNLLSRYVSP